MTDLDVDAVASSGQVAQGEDLRTVAVIGGDWLAQHVGAAVNGRVRVHRQQWWHDDGSIDVEQVVHELAAEGALAVFIGRDVPLPNAFEIAQRIDRDHARMSVILVAVPTPDLWRDVLRSGIRDVVDPATVDLDLEPALQRALERGERLRYRRAPDVPEAPTTGRVVVVISPKGGSGKTMVSSNLTVALAGLGQGSVALVDLDVQFGDTASALGLVPEHTIADVASSTSVDATALKVFLTQHAPSGAYVLCGAESPEEADSLTDERAVEAIDVLSRDFAYVVVDTAAGADERTLAVLERATDVVLVANMDVSSVRNLGKAVRALERVGLVPPERHFVLNRADEQLGLSAADVEAALGMTVDVAVPSSRSVPVSMNQGRSIVLEEPASPVARGLGHLARRLADLDDDEHEPRSWFTRRKRER